MYSRLGSPDLHKPLNIQGVVDDRHAYNINPVNRVQRLSEGGCFCIGVKITGASLNLGVGLSNPLIFTTAFPLGRIAETDSKIPHGFQQHTTRNTSWFLRLEIPTTRNTSWFSATSGSSVGST